MHDIGKISVIVPVYKVEQYLPKCVDSLLAQTYRNLEIILVDDGSPDRCPQICDEYSEKDGRVVVIHQENRGVSAARNRGLETATGEYIGFCDSDDFVAPEMYEKLKDIIEETGAELGICGYHYVDTDGNITRLYPESGTELINQREVLERYFDMPPTIRMIVCNKLFRAGHIRALRFSENIKGAEDGELLWEYIMGVRHAAVIHEPLYYSCERPGSATRGGLKSDSILPALDIYMATRLWTDENYPELRQHTQAYYMDACLLNYNLHCKSGGKRQAPLIAELRKRVAREFPSALFNPEVYWKTRMFYGLFAIGAMR